MPSSGPPAATWSSRRKGRKPRVFALSDPEQGRRPSRGGAEGRVRSVQETAAWLKHRGVSAAAVRAVLVQGRRQGWLDDAACARLWADHWARRGYAWAAISERLRAKGLDEASVRGAGERLELIRADRARAQELAGRWALPGTGVLQAGSLARRLAARGYDVELIEDVVAVFCP